LNDLYKMYLGCHEPRKGQGETEVVHNLMVLMLNCCYTPNHHLNHKACEAISQSMFLKLSNTEGMEKIFNEYALFPNKHQFSRTRFKRAHTVSFLPPQFKLIPVKDKLITCHEILCIEEENDIVRVKNQSNDFNKNT